MNTKELYQNIRLKKSYLCIGLDSDMKKIPHHLKKEDDPMLEFNRAIIDHTHKYCVAYKINTAFYEMHGSKGWSTLEQTVRYIKTNHPDMFLIADAKRGDIGNTARMYAQTFFSWLDVDAVTLSPYMGYDSVQPFLEFNGKWVIILALTSNQGAEDFQYFFSVQENKHLYEKVVERSATWGSSDKIMFVSAATRTAELKNIRKMVPDHFLLIPGIGAQGGNLKEVSLQGMNKQCGILVNASRSVIFASSSESFARAAQKKASAWQKEMQNYLLNLDI